MIPKVIPTKRLRVAAGMGALAVAAGAFGAHGLKTLVSPIYLTTWETAARYHLIHAVVLLLLTAMADRLSDRAQRWSFRLIFVGTSVFSGSLYAMVGLMVLLGDSNKTPNLLGALTPIGGALLIAGWLSLMLPNTSPRNASE